MLSFIIIINNMKAQEKKESKQSVNKQMGIGSLGMQWNKQLLFLQTYVSFKELMEILSIHLGKTLSIYVRSAVHVSLEQTTEYFQRMKHLSTWIKINIIECTADNTIIFPHKRW